MGRGTLLIAVAGLLGAASVAYIGLRSQFEMNDEQHRYEHQVVARDVALSGLDRGLSAVKLELMGVDRSFGDRPVSGGIYDVAISENHYGDLNLTSRGSVGDMRHEIESNVIFESPLQAALAIAGEGLRVDSSGTYMISGMDARMPSVKTGAGFLRAVKGVMTDNPAAYNEVRSRITAESMQGDGGDGSVSQGVDVYAYENVFGQAISRSDKIFPVPPYFGSFGTANDPAVVQVNGDFEPTGTFKGRGILIVQDGDFVVGNDFLWEGLVLIRRSMAADLNVRMNGNAVVYGGMAIFDAPGGASSAACEDVPFTITGVETVPTVPFLLKTEVLGAAISYGGSYDMPVTSRVHKGDSSVDPWGTYNEALTGNVNRDGTFSYEPADALPGGTGITVSGTSWVRNDGDGTSNDHWNPYMEQNSETGGSQLKVLRNGDPVPDIQGYLDQGSVADFVSNFIDPLSNTISLEPNQSIYLFELGTSNSASAAYDFQDLVVLVSMLRSDVGCSFGGGTGAEIAFSMTGSTQIRYSGEAIAKLGSKVPAIESEIKVVVAAQRDVLVTPEEIPVTAAAEVR